MPLTETPLLKVTNSRRPPDGDDALRIPGFWIGSHESRILNSVSSTSWAIITKARATYYKPLWEGFAKAHPAGSRSVLIWPREHASEHPEELTTPVHERFVIRDVACRWVRRGGGGVMGAHHGGHRSALPSPEAWRCLRGERPRGVIVHEFSPFTLTGLVYARLHRVPCLLMTEVGLENARCFPSKVRLWHSLWSRLVHGVIAACPSARVPVSGRAIPSFAAYHAVDAERFTPVARAATEGGSVVFAFSGQLIHRKGLDLLFAAAGRLRVRVAQPFRLRIIGGGDDTWARGLARDAGVADITDWTGFLAGDAMKEALGTADVFVLPTRQDTYGVVVHEAACLGLPLLISRHAGASRVLVRDGVNGFVIDPAETGDLAEKMRLLLAASTRARMGSESRAIGEETSSPRRGAALWQWLDEHVPDAFLVSQHAKPAIQSC